MTRSLIILLVVTMAIGALAGCSGDNGVSPRRDTGTTPRSLGVKAATIGPSEIVFCIDVSDSISAGELESIVNGLGGCLSNQDLIPQNGQVAVVLTVYADTVATILNGTTVTADNLQNLILPALQGLLTNRVVNAGLFDLSGALEDALTILGGALVTDRHILVVGSGVASNPSAVTTASQALASAGVMASTLAVGADAVGEALLKSVADATGGFSGSGADCADALAYMLQVEIDLEPKSAELPRGAEATITATVFRGGDPQAYPEVGLSVVIAVVSGPNAGVADTTATNASGIASLTYLGSGGPGSDTIVGTVIQPGTGAALTDTATVTWLNAPPVCNAGGPYTAVVTTDIVQVALDAGASSDADGDSLSFSWSVQCGGASFNDIHVVAPLLTLTGDCLCVDSLMVNLTVSDGFDSTVCEAVVRIDDLRPPVIVMRKDPISVWPPNHKYQTVTPEMLVVSATDACGVPIDISQVMIVEVRSDEPDDANGDGKTINDIVVTCPNRVDLRAERMGGGNGRVYTIVYRFFTANGVSADVEGLAVVPHDASGKTVVDDGDAYVVTPRCGDRRLAARGSAH